MLLASASCERFTESVRSRGQVSSCPPHEDTLLDLGVIMQKKREQKKALQRMKEKTVATLIDEVSVKCSKQEKQKVGV